MADPPLRVGRYGTVGNWPASSCASRAALSPASWVAFSFGTNVPLGAVLGTVAELLVVVVVAPVAALPAAELSTVPPIAPPASEPASTVVRIHFFEMFICFHLLSWVHDQVRPH